MPEELAIDVMKTIKVQEAIGFSNGSGKARILKGQAAISFLDDSRKARILKGQAAIEYLLTYGWAILLLIAVIAAIFATGIFSPSFFVSQECFISPDLKCVGFQLTETKLFMNVSNNFGYRIKVNSISLDGEEVYNTITEIGRGESMEFELDLPEQKNPGEIERIAVTLSYYTCAPEVNEDCLTNDDYEHTLSGRIVGVVLEE